MEEMTEFICAGEWKSTLNGKNDGRFELKVDPKNGNITGDHFLPPNGTTILKVTGTCTHSQNHHIEIRETREGQKFRYHGQIIPDPSGAGEHKTQDGKRTKMANDAREKDQKAKFDDDVWTGVRTT